VTNLARRAALASVACAVLLGSLKAYAAWRTGSVAVLASLADSLLDLVASLVTLGGVHWAAQPADREHRFPPDVDQVGPQRDIELFAEPVRRFVAEFSALAGLGRIGEPYAAGVAAHLIPTVLPYTLGSAAMFTTETINGRPLGADAFDVMVSLAAGRSLGDGVAPDVSRLLDVFPYYGPPYTAAEQRALLPMPRHGVAL